MSRTTDPADAAAVRLVRAGAQHLRFVRRLSNEVFARFGDYGATLPLRIHMTDVRSIVAEDDYGSELGFAIWSPGWNPGVLDLEAIAVDPGSWRRGIGRLLLEHVERDAQRATAALPAGVLRLTVAEDNVAARALFERRGFEPIPGDEGVYPRGQRSLGMCKDIKRDPLHDDA